MTAARHGFPVWAPAAQSVEVVVGGKRRPLAKDEATGWWRGDALAAEPAAESAGVDYGFVVDGKGPFPDPRSRRQPFGVHDLSRDFDPGVFDWTDGTWRGRPIPGSVIYELHIGTFTDEGTLDAAAGKLDYLHDLGIDFVELLPVNAFNGIYNWGYDGVLWYAVHEQYGGPEGYQRFVNACHKAGLGVIQDVVYNHLGPSGNYLPEFGPYLRSDSANTWGSSLNLDGPGSDGVREYIIDNAEMWLRDYHVDGLRLDAVHAMVDSRAVNILEELEVRVAELSRRLGRPLGLIAESDLNDPRLIASRDAGGDGLDGQWSDDFHHALHVALTGETTGYYADFADPHALAKTITSGFFHDGTYSSFRRRHHGRPIATDTTPASRLVVFSQDHDQIGNRAAGDRLAATLDDGQLAIAAVLTLLGPNTPMLFMGEEWAASTPWQFFTSHPEPELGDATAKGRIAEFARMGWDESAVPNPQDPATFERSKLRWDERLTGRHARILEFYRAVIALRRARPELTDARFATIDVETLPGGDGLIVRRKHTAILVNLSAEPRQFPGFPPELAEPDDILLSFGAHSFEDGKLTLHGHSLAVIGQSRGDWSYD
ncbi:MAG: malto-oligosyltrehalose trehalohydrolase [Salinibacterium sp.]|nr:malto-oligosyltrehalose trehalohydrolase [Salinibacterium sp.]